MVAPTPLLVHKKKTLTNLYFTSPKSPYLSFPSVTCSFNFTAHILYQFTSTHSYSYLPFSILEFQIFIFSLLLISVRNFRLSTLFCSIKESLFLVTVVTWLFFFFLFFFFNSKHLPADINFPVKRRNRVNLKNRPRFSSDLGLDGSMLFSSIEVLKVKRIAIGRDSRLMVN